MAKPWTKLDDTLPELPRQPQKGDRIRVKEASHHEVREACKAAGWFVNVEAIRIVTRTDKFGPGGSRRLFVEGPPFAFNERDVEIAWNDTERREFLRANGHRV